ncbi:MAG: TOBE domain-containing protein, partial [Candidatus Binatia bacterium]
VYVTHDQVEAMTLGHRVTVLDRGRVQQTATPRDLYERPANAFVAGFIGNPPMNLFAASLRIDERGEPLLVVGEQSAPISPPGATGDRLRSLAGRRVTAGVRAEAVRLATDGPGTLGAVVEHVERLGHETLASVQIADATGAEAVRWIVRLPAMQDLAKGQAVRLELEPKSVYFFGEDGKAL